MALPPLLAMTDVQDSQGEMIPAEQAFTCVSCKATDHIDIGKRCHWCGDMAHVPGYQKRKAACSAKCASREHVLCVACEDKSIKCLACEEIRDIEDTERYLRAQYNARGA